MPTATTPMPKAKKETAADRLAVLERRRNDLTAAFAESREKRKALVEAAGERLAAGDDPKVEREQIDALSGEIEVTADGLAQLDAQIAAARRDLRAEQAVERAAGAQEMLDAVVERVQAAEDAVDGACLAITEALRATQDFSRAAKRMGALAPDATEPWRCGRYLLWRTAPRLTSVMPGLRADVPAHSRFTETPAAKTYAGLGARIIAAISRVNEES